MGLLLFLLDGVLVTAALLVNLGLLLLFVLGLQRLFHVLTGKR